MAKRHSLRHHQQSGLDVVNKRYRTPKAKEGELLVKYGQEYGDRDLYYCYPENDCGMGRDSRIVMLAFESADIFDGKL